MKKTIMKLLLPILLMTLASVNAQEKIIEFTTNYSVISTYNNKLQMKFELYNDSLIMTQIDKKVVKYYKKKGLPLSTTIKHNFKKEESSVGIYYTFRNETEDYTIIIKSKVGKPSVRIRLKDEFSNQIIEQFYFNN